MSQMPRSDDLQFQTVEPTATVMGQSCVLCRRPITSMYFAVRDKTLCPDCAAKVRAGPAGSEAVRLFRAFAFGLGAAIAGALLWWAIIEATRLEIGYVALAVGYMVGKAVRKGSGNRGGLAYQIMAVLLTYLVITAAHFPQVYREISEHRQQSVEMTGSQNPRAEVIAVAVISVALAFALPVLNATTQPIGLLIAGIAVWEAWKFTRRTPIVVTGPYLVNPRQPIPLSPLPAPPPKGDSGVIL